MKQAWAMRYFLPFLFNTKLRINDKTHFELSWFSKRQTMHVSVEEKSPITVACEALCAVMFMPYFTCTTMPYFMLCCANMQIVTDISKQHSAIIFRVKKSD